MKKYLLAALMIAVLITGITATAAYGYVPLKSGTVIKKSGSFDMAKKVAKSPAQGRLQGMPDLTMDFSTSNNGKQVSWVVSNVGNSDLNLIGNASVNVAIGYYDKNDGKRVADCNYLISGINIAASSSVNGICKMQALDGGAIAASTYDGIAVVNIVDMTNKVFENNENNNKVSKTVIVS